MPTLQGWRPATTSAESEAAVLFVTYLWGKPQLPIYRGNAELRLHERDMDKALKRPGPDSVNRETKEKSHDP